MTTRKNRITIFFQISITLLLLFAAGCSGPQLKVQLSTTANLNMDNKAEPLPVVVRIYQLSDPRTFENATFNELWKSDLTVLGDSLLRKDTLTLDPATSQRIFLDRHDQTEYVGFMAAFNNQENGTWRSVKEIQPSVLGLDISNSLEVSLKNNSIQVN